MTLVEADRRFLQPRRGQAGDPRAGRFGEGRSQGRVVQVGVGDEDVRDPLAFDRPLQRL